MTDKVQAARDLLASQMTADDAQKVREGIGCIVWSTDALAAIRDALETTEARYLKWAQELAERISLASLENPTYHCYINAKTLDDAFLVIEESLKSLANPTRVTNDTLTTLRDKVGTMQATSPFTTAVASFQRVIEAIDAMRPQSDPAHALAWELWELANPGHGPFDPHKTPPATWLRVARHVIEREKVR